MKPDRCRAGQNLLPGRAKCQPVAAEYRLGLMPQNSTCSGASGGGSTSGMVRFLAASRSAGLGRGGGERFTQGLAGMDADQVAEVVGRGLAVGEGGAGGGGRLGAGLGAGAEIRGRGA